MVLAVMIFVIGCSCGNLGNMFQDEKPTTQKQTDKTTSDNRTITDKVTDKVTDVATEGEKIGIPECDEMMDYFRNKIDSEETDFFTKAILKTMEAKFREGIKQSVGEGKSDKAETAKWCKEFKKNLDQEEAKTKK